MSSGATLMVHDLQTKRTPLHAAAYNGHVVTIRVLLRNLTNTTHVDCMCMEGKGWESGGERERERRERERGGGGERERDGAVMTRNNPSSL